MLGPVGKEQALKCFEDTVQLWIPERPPTTSKTCSAQIFALFSNYSGEPPIQGSFRYVAIPVIFPTTSVSSGVCQASGPQCESG